MFQDRPFKVTNSSLGEGGGDFSAGDYVGEVFTFDGVFPRNGTCALITGVTLINKNDDGTETNAISGRLEMYSRAPTSDGSQASGAPHEYNANDMAYYEGTLHLSAADDGYSEAASSPNGKIATCDKSNIGWIVASSSDGGGASDDGPRPIYCRFITDTAINNYDTGDLVFRLQGFH